MKSRTEQEEKLVRYLLGRLTADEKSEIEERFFADEQFFEQLLVVEDALMDEYVSNELSASERQAFEEYLKASPQQRRDLGFTRRLISDIAEIRAARGDEKSLDKSPLPHRISLRQRLESLILKNGYAWIILGFIGLCIYLIVSNSDLRKQIQQLEAERLAWENSRRGTTGNNNTSGQPQPGTTVSLILTATNLIRGGGDIPGVQLPSEAKQLHIQIELQTQPGAGSYFVTITAVGGKEIWRGLVSSPGQSDPPRIDLYVPIERLKNGVYTLKVERLTEDNQLDYVGEYAFRIGP